MLLDLVLTIPETDPDDDREMDTHRSLVTSININKINTDVSVCYPDGTTLIKITQCRD